MTKHSILGLSMLLAVASCSAQSGSTDKPFIITCEDNIHWLDSLKNLPLDAQMAMVKQRIIADTGAYVKKTYPAGQVPNPLNGPPRVAVCCKPLVLLDGYRVLFNGPDPGDDLNTFLQVLGQLKIKKIAVYKDIDMTSIFGASANCGVVMIKVKDKEDSKLVEKYYGHTK